MEWDRAMFNGSFVVNIAHSGPKSAGIIWNMTAENQRVYYPSNLLYLMGHSFQNKPSIVGLPSKNGDVP